MHPCIYIDGDNMIWTENGVAADEISMNSDGTKDLERNKGNDGTLLLGFG